MEQAELERKLEAECQKTIQLRVQLAQVEGARGSAASDHGRQVREPSILLVREPERYVNPHNFIPGFNKNRDDLDAYLKRFENVATGQEWPKDKCATALSLCLSGEALKVFGRLSPEEALDYEKAKLAILQRFRFMAEGYREKFRHSRPQDGETGKQYATRLDTKSGFASRKSLRGAVPDMEPLEVLSSLSSPVQCLAACLLKSPRCKAFAFGNRSCDLLQRSPCDSQRPMRDAPGFALYDVLTRDRMTVRLLRRTRPVNQDSGLAGDAVRSSTMHDVTSEPGDRATSLAPDEADRIQQRDGAAFVFRAGPTTFQAARHACLAEGLAMAMPVTYQDHKALVELMRRNRAPRLWIGVQRSVKGNTTFMNGEQVPESSRRWGKGQPNNSGGTQICVEMIESLAHLWNDYDCENRAAYACQQTSSAPQSSDGLT
ncbi:uncharacterized protein LOC142765963 [Rhipicephalus microplus]|uniref:uncharacterized protein LOC142765963 n=1 Tax=Rhipicephalus microplus TaxID=6941 RepID=UPI003F6D2DD4